MAPGDLRLGRRALGPECPSIRWLTCTTVDPQEFGARREDIRLALEEENIESRPLWKPMHLQPLYAACRVRGGSVSEELFANGLCLPSGSNLTEHDLVRIVEIILATAKRAAPAGSEDRGQSGDGRGRGRGRRRHSVTVSRRGGSGGGMEKALG